MKFKCDNCGYIGAETNFKNLLEGSVRDLTDLVTHRLDIGGMFTNMECRNCGALAYPVRKPRAEAVEPGNIMTPFVIQMEPDPHNCHGLAVVPDSNVLATEGMCCTLDWHGDEGEPKRGQLLLFDGVHDYPLLHIKLRHDFRGVTEIVIGNMLRDFIRFEDNSEEDYTDAFK